MIQTLSLWKDFESVYTFSYYSESHGKALSNRPKTSVKNRDEAGEKYPTYIMWWVNDTVVPTWDDACVRYEYLHDQKRHSPYVFDFKNLFDKDGTPLKELDQEKVERYKIEIKDIEKQGEELSSNKHSLFTSISNKAKNLFKKS